MSRHFTRSALKIRLTTDSHQYLGNPLAVIIRRNGVLIIKGRKKDRNMELQNSISDLTAKDIMTHPIHCAQESWSLGDLTSFFATHRVSGAPVVNEDNIATGIITVTDLVKREMSFTDADLRLMASNKFDELLYAPLPESDIEWLTKMGKSCVQVKDIMTPKLFGVEMDTSIIEVADLMTTKRGCNLNCVSAHY